MNNLKDKVAIITGASRGIGMAIASVFQAEGAKLVLTARQNLGALKIFKYTKIVKLDLSNNDDIELLVTETLKAFGRIDILVNNAAVFYQTDFEAISEEELNNIIAVDLKGPFLLLQKVLMQMKKQRNGKIINIASGSGRIGSASAPHYAAAKAGIIALTKSLARLYGPFNININAVAPSLIDTQMIKQIPQNRLNNLIDAVPLKRLGSPKEVANLIFFLASSASDYITGQTISIDGGLSMV